MSVACDAQPGLEDALAPAAPGRAEASAGGVVGPTFDDVYRAHAAEVARWAAHLGRPWIDVEDVVQEVFIVVRRRLDEFRGDAKLTTWLYRITAKIVSDARRKERFRSWLRRSRRGELEDALTSALPTPAEAIERDQSRAIVYTILDRLPPKYRTVLVLFEIEGHSGEDVAAMTGVKVATVWVHLHRARALFLAEMDALEGRPR
jgi:RNA polymerase sigma-70 factor (ECF subfamily)